MVSRNSIHAVTALNSLSAASFQNQVIRGSIWDAKLGGDRSHPNAPLFGEMEWYLTCRQIAHAGDVLNTYCQSILAEILIKDSTVWDSIRGNLRSEKKGVSVGIEKLEVQSESDKGVREVFRNILETMWCNEAEIISVLRNKIVHQAGYDLKGDVLEVIQKFPPGEMHIYPVALDPEDFPISVGADKKLIIDAKAGYWASCHILNLIHLMDQNLCCRFNLERAIKPVHRHSYHTRSGSGVRMLDAGQALPVVATESDDFENVLPPLKFNPYPPMANEKEKNCARTWHRVSEELYSFVEKIINEVGVVSVNCSAKIAGVARSHTLEGHDRELFFQLNPKNELSRGSNILGIRLRQNNFKPFITIWSTYTQMKDYDYCELSDEVKEHIILAIQQTIS